MHRLRTGLLAGLYVAYVLLFHLHHFVAPEHHEEQKICHAAPGEKHLHTEDYAAADCSLCQIAVSVAEPVDMPAPALLLPELPLVEANFSTDKGHAAHGVSLARPRGPPARFA